MPHVLKNSVYCYVEPRRSHPLYGEVRYVGKDERFGERGRAVGKHAFGHVYQWLEELARHVILGGPQNELDPIIRILFEFDECEGDVRLLREAETFWIAEGRRLGWPLLNFTAKERYAVGGLSKMTIEEMSTRSKNAGKKTFENKTGWFGMTAEEKSVAGRKGGKKTGSINGRKHVENGTGIFGMTAEEKFVARGKGGRSGKVWETRRACWGSKGRP